MIEHVAPERRDAFARELRRVARGWFVQTPALSFPIEPHALLALRPLAPGARAQALLAPRRRRALERGLAASPARHGAPVRRASARAPRPADQELGGHRAAAAPPGMPGASMPYVADDAGEPERLQAQVVADDAAEVERLLAQVAAQEREVAALTRAARRSSRAPSGHALARRAGDRPQPRRGAAGGRAGARRLPWGASRGARRAGPRGPARAAVAARRLSALPSAERTRRGSARARLRGPRPSARARRSRRRRSRSRRGRTLLGFPNR